jgi:uncharacterized iron-regulated membrane protein
MTRDFWNRMHRYAGLAMAIFLAMAGLTGSIIAFEHELDAWLNPALFHTQNREVALSPSELVARAERRDPRLRVAYVPPEPRPGESARLFVAPRLDPATGKPFTLDFDELFADAVTGESLGTRRWGACCLERKHLIPFLYRMHHTLHLPGRAGIWLMGIVAIIWVFDCFVGGYLTFPRARPFFARWKPAWQIKRGAGAYRVNLDLHRAGGLWFWGVLLVLAVSSVYLNLREEVFEPLVALFSPLTPSPIDRARRPEAPIEPGLSFDDALARAREEAERRGWPQSPGGVLYRASDGVYVVYFFASQRDRGAGLGSPSLYFDGTDGRLVGEVVPAEGTAGDIFMRLQFPLHSGRIAGLAGRIAVSATGVVVAILSITGVVIWLKKRRPRVAALGPPADQNGREVKTNSDQNRPA